MAEGDREAIATSETLFAGGASTPTVVLESNARSSITSDSDSPTDGRFHRVATLGKGGMGRVDLVVDRVLHRELARKVALAPESERWLLAEAQVAAQLEHPSLPPIYDVVTDEAGRPAYTMRVIRGRTLREVISRPEEGDTFAKTRTQLLGILRQVCLAVDYAHAHGVVHRDLKPENIVVGEFGEVYVLDWGIAVIMPGASVRADSPLPSEMSAGSLGYMSPEQIRAEPLDPRTDVFALGVMLHEVLTGVRPFHEANPAKAWVRASAPGTVPPSADAPTLEQPFADLVRACLRQDRSNRLPSARAIADAIDAYQDRERDQLVRTADADELCARAGEHYALFEQMRIDASAAEQDAARMLEAIEPWATTEEKRSAWLLEEKARSLHAEAARSYTRAETAWLSALTRSSEHRDSRRGLARLYYRALSDAETRGDEAAFAQALERARTYDEGTLQLELACESELVVETVPSGVEIAIATYRREGPLLVAGAERSLGVSPTAIERLPSGSHRLTVRVEGRAIKVPLSLERARRHRVHLRIPEAHEVPEGMVFVAGGPFSSFDANGKLVERTLCDFAIGRFPITFGRYVPFLDSMSAEERQRHVPAYGDGGVPFLIRKGDGWEIDNIELGSRPDVYERRFDLPVFGVSWDSANAYVRWLRSVHGLAYRLPTALEWEKACRGVDGRPFPMGVAMDYSFAKLRQSRKTIAEPEPVGAFPLDESPYGVCDMAGGVADWTATFLDGEPPPDIAGGTRLAVRCGNHYGQYAATPLRSHANTAGERIHGTGFRVALSLDAARTSHIVVERMVR